MPIIEDARSYKVSLIKIHLLLNVTYLECRFSRGCCRRARTGRWIGVNLKGCVIPVDLDDADFWLIGHDTGGFHD